MLSVLARAHDGMHVYEVRGGGKRGVVCARSSYNVVVGSCVIEYYST